MTSSKEETKRTTSRIGPKCLNTHYTESTTRDAGEKEEGAVVGSVVDGIANALRERLDQHNKNRKSIQEDLDFGV